jgi:uncharacterized protein (TIGR02996 family)
VLEETFREHILAEPDDEVARLAYADWLQEQGGAEREARAEFIRVQCQLAHLEEPGRWNDWAEAARRLRALRQRERELLDQHGQEWTRPVLAYAMSPVFRRGFIEQVSVYGSTFVQHAPQLFGLAPIRRIHFVGVPQRIKELAACPHLARLAGMELMGCGDAQLRRLLDSPFLTRLTELSLRGLRLTQRHVQVLAECPLLARLDVLDLRQPSHSYNVPLLPLLRSPHLARVGRLLLPTPRAFRQEELTALARELAEHQEPVVLRLALWLTAGQQPAPRGRPARDLARRAAGKSTPSTLCQGLDDSREKVRAAAAWIMSHAGSKTTAGLPELVRRFYEPTEMVRRQAAGALARMLPALPEALQSWLAVLANPFRTAEANLEEALARVLPSAVRRAFGELCVRRTTWRAAIAGRPVPAEPRSLLDIPAIWRATQSLADEAAALAVRHRKPTQDSEAIQQAARTREYTWLIARLCEQLQAEFTRAPGA